MKYQSIEKVRQYILKKDNLIIIILTGILLLVIAWPIEEKGKEKNNVSDLWDNKNGNVNVELTRRSDSDDSAGNFENDRLIDDGIRQEEYIIENLERRLEEMLASMHGAGRVKVMITLYSGGEKIVEKDIPLERSNIVETDSAGGNRSTNEMYSQEETVYITNSAGDKIPYVVRMDSARVAGVSVSAEGGDNPLVLKNISEVIQALFGIEEHKIKVVKMKKEE